MGEYSRRGILGKFAVLSGAGILISGCGVGIEEPSDSLPAAKILAGGVDLRAIMRQRGFYATDIKTRMGYLVEGIYRVSRDMGIWRLVPELVSSIDRGEGLIYQVKGNPFPLVGLDEYEFHPGEVVVVRKKLRNGEYSGRLELTI